MEDFALIIEAAQSLKAGAGDLDERKAKAQAALDVCWGVGWG
jgi:hypothetical protein